MSFLRTSAVVVLTALLGACATPMRVNLTPENRAKLTEVKARVVVVQDEVIVAVEASNVGAATGGGLIGALVDSAITNRRVKDSQEAMGPFYASIESIDYRKDLDAAVRRDLGRYPLRITEFTTTPRSISAAQLTALRNELKPGQALLVLVPRYSLTADFRNIDVETIASLWVNNPADANPVQRGALRYQSAPVGPGGKDSIKLWSDQNAAAFRAVLNESIAETLTLVLADFDSKLPAVAADKLQSYPLNLGSGSGQIKAQPVSETETRVLVLGADQKLYSLPKAPKTTASAAP